MEAHHTLQGRPAELQLCLFAFIVETYHLAEAEIGASEELQRRFNQFLGEVMGRVTTAH